MVELIEVLIQVFTAPILTWGLTRFAPRWSRGSTATMAALAIPLFGLYFTFVGFNTLYEIRKCTIGFCGKILLRVGALAIGIFIFGFVISIFFSWVLATRRRAAAARQFE